MFILNTVKTIKALIYLIALSFITSASASMIPCAVKWEPGSEYIVKGTQKYGPLKFKTIRTQSGEIPVLISDNSSVATWKNPTFGTRVFFIDGEITVCKSEQSKISK